MRRSLMRLVLLGIGCVLALLLLEGTIRLLGLAPSQGIGSVTESDFARIPGLLTPGQDLVDREKPALPYHVRINALGFRGNELDEPKPTGALRILAVGDSFTYGDFVDDDETLPAQLEAALAERCGAVEVINAGVGGTTLVTHEQMIRRALALRPDVVLLTFSENDVVDLAAPMWWSLAENRRAKSRFPLSIVYPILRHTALWNFALRVRGAALARARPDAPDSETDRDPGAAESREAVDALRADYAQRLATIRDLTAESGAGLVYALYPSHHTVLSADREEQMAWAEQLGKNLGLVTVSLTEALRRSAESIDHLYLLPEDGHPSPRGYGIAAQTLAGSVDWSAYGTGGCRAAEAAAPAVATGRP